MHESISAPSIQPLPPVTPTPGEDRRRMAFQVDHPEVGFSPLAFCENPDERWVAYWWSAEEGRPDHVTGPTLGDVLASLVEKFG